MAFNLLDVINAGVIDNKTTESSTPIATVDLNTNIDLNNGGWIAIIILLIIVIISIIINIFFYINYRDIKQHNKQQESNTKELENQIINEYNKLSSQEKQIIIDTMINFNRTKDK